MGGTMSSITINGDTSGSVILQAPSVAGSTTLTLPSTSGTVVTTNTIPAGQVIQVVNAVDNTQGSRNTNTLADTGLTASITPSSSSTNILVLVTQHFCTVTDNVVQFRLLRSSTTLIDSIDVLGSQTAGTLLGVVSFNYLDSPASTSSVTYKTQYCSRDVGETVYVNIDSNTSTLTLMEIKQ